MGECSKVLRFKKAFWAWNKVCDFSKTNLASNKARVLGMKNSAKWLGVWLYSFFVQSFISTKHSLSVFLLWLFMLMIEWLCGYAINKRIFIEAIYYQGLGCNRLFLGYRSKSCWPWPWSLIEEVCYQPS